jgi:hypothetical protein
MWTRWLSLDEELSKDAPQRLKAVQASDLTAGLKGLLHPVTLQRKKEKAEPPLKMEPSHLPNP